MEVKLTLKSWDQYDATFSWNSLLIKGVRDTSDSFKWFFPAIHIQKAYSNKIDWEYIIGNHEILRFGESLKKHFEEDAKKELEQLLSEKMTKTDNRRLLLSMLFNDILLIGD